MDALLYIYVGLRLEKAQPLISLYQFCHSNNMRDNDAGGLSYILIIMSIMCLVCMALPTDATAVSSISLGNRKVYLKFCVSNFCTPWCFKRCYCCTNQNLCYTTREQCEQVCPVCNPICPPAPSPLGKVTSTTDVNLAT